MDLKQLMQSKMVQKDPGDGWYFLFFLSLLIRVRTILHPSPFLILWNVNTSFENCILQNSGLPWIPPKKAFSLDLGDLSDAIGGALGVCALPLLLPFFSCSLIFH
jgi:hypothetical protein